MESQKFKFVEIMIIIVIIIILSFFSINFIKNFNLDYQIKKCINSININDKDLVKERSKCFNKYKD